MIDLPSQREKVKFKTSQAKTLEIVEKMLSDLKVKTEGTLQVLLELFQEMRRKLFLKKIQIPTNYLMFLQKKVFDDDLQEIKRFVVNSNPMSFTKKLVFKTYFS